MTIALTEDENRLTSKLNKAILMAPCTVLGSNETVRLDEASMQKVGRFTDIGIYSFPTSDWENDLVKICNTFDESICTKMTNTNANAWARKSVRNGDHVA